MANTLLTISMITREALAVLENSLKFTSKVNREYDSKFGVEGAKIGTVINVRKPPSYTVSVGQALDLQNVTESQVPVRLTTQAHVDFQFSSQDLALNIDDFSKRFIAPAVTALANKIDADGMGLYKKVANHVGTYATTPTTFETYLNAGARLDNNAAPQDENRSLALSPAMQVKAVTAGLAYFNPVSNIAEQYRTGRMSEAVGFNWYMDQNVQTHTLGVSTGTPLTNGTTTSGSQTVITDGWTTTNATLTEGTVVSFESVYAVNPVSKAPLSYLKQFTLTADCAVTTGNDDITLPLNEPMYFSGPQQNCYAAVGYLADGVAIDVMDAAQAALAGNSGKTSAQALAFHKDAFTLACADLPLPGGVDMASRVSDKQLGLSIRLVRQYDINSDNFPCRLDILYGWSALRPELACRISG